MPASTRLAVPVSAAVTRIRTDWPAYGDRLALAAAHAPARLVAAPSCSNTVVVPPECTTLTRTRSVLPELLRWARYHEKLRLSVAPAGSAIAGDCTVVVPPSRSLVPALDPAVAPVTRSLTPL